MNILKKVIIFVAGLVAMPLAMADVFKCVEEDGHVTYTNARPSPKAKCTTLSRESRVSTVPGRAANTPSPTGFPKVDGETQKARDNDRRKILEQELSSELSNLEQAKKELAEQEKLVLSEERNANSKVVTVTVIGKDGKPVTQTKTVTMPGGSINEEKVQARRQLFIDKVALHERNIEALKKEIGNLK